MTRRERRALLPSAVVVLAVFACEGAKRDRSAEVEQAATAAEAAPAGSSSPAGISAARSPTTLSNAGPPVAGAQAAWASAIARDIDGLELRSRQILTVQRMRAGNDPWQKSADLIAHLQWCDQGSLKACLHAGHVLLFNECLFDRAHVVYRKAASLAEALPAGAVDNDAVDGQPQRQELRLGLRLGDPANQGDDQRRSIAAICGAAAERDRPLWDQMFARYERGDLTPAASPSSTEERLSLGAIRKEMFVEAEAQIDGLERLHAGAARDLRQRLVGAASGLCAQDDLVSCGTAAYLHAARCRLDEMTEAYRRFESGVSSLDAANRGLAQKLAQDVIGPARAYSAAEGPMRELLRQSMCKGI